MITARFMTIRQTARTGDFPNEAVLRGLVKEGRCPGFYQRTRFYIDTALLRKQLDGDCSKPQLDGEATAR